MARASLTGTASGSEASSLDRNFDRRRACGLPLARWLGGVRREWLTAGAEVHLPEDTEWGQDEVQWVIPTAMSCGWLGGRVSGCLRELPWPGDRRDVPAGKMRPSWLSGIPPSASTPAQQHRVGALSLRTEDQLPGGR